MGKTKKVLIAIAFVILLGYSAVVSLIAFGGNGVLDSGSNTDNAGGIFLRSYKAADVDAKLAGDEIVKVTQNDDVYFFDGPGTEQAIIFYPGANVEYTSYAPLMYKLAEKGMDGFLVKMPLDYAFAGIGLAEPIINEHPEYSHWNLAGHSLGGAMIATYASLTSHHIDGVYLLAAYAASDISDVDEVLVIYGSEDGVLERDKVESGRKYCPENYREYIIEGGNHAQFGSYGEQKNDGTATISAEEQITKTVEQIMLNKK